MDDEERASFVLLGRDVLKIPCLRTSFLYSFSSYIGVGLATFLFTSKPAFSSHVGFAAFIVVTFGYYTNCRLNYARDKLQMTQIQQSLQKFAVMEDTVPQKRKIVPKMEDA